MTALELLRDALSRVVWIRETVGYEHDQALEDLEHDLAGALSRFELREAA